MIWLFTFWCYANNPLLNPYCMFLGRLESQEFDTEKKCTDFADDFLTDMERSHRYDGGGPFRFEYSCKQTAPRLKVAPRRVK